MHKRVDGLGDAPGPGPAPRGGAVAATLAVGLALLIGGIALVMSKSGTKETGSNRVRLYGALAVMHAGDTLCQPDELVPAGTGAVRAAIGPTSGRDAKLRVTVRASADGRVIARGAQRLETGDAVSVPIRPLMGHDTPARVCFTIDHGPAFLISGAPAQPGTATIRSQAIGGDVRIVYVEPRPRSWWSFAPTAMERMDAGRRPSGATIAIVALLLSIAAAGLGCAALVRGRP